MTIAALEARYEPRLIGSRWCVWDNRSGTPASVNGCWQVDLILDDADDLADCLNFLDNSNA